VYRIRDNYTGGMYNALDARSFHSCQSAGRRIGAGRVCAPTPARPFAVTPVAIGEETEDIAKLSRHVCAGGMQRISCS
jgi:hypothetical protein